MNVTQVNGGAPVRPSTARRVALVAATSMAVAGGGLLVHAALAGARFETVVAALGFAAGAALVGLLALSPGGLSVIRDDDA